jgi:sulfoxide reductase catalytic subunit YedY
MLIKEKSSILSSEITDEAVFLNRRKLIKAAVGISIASLLPASVSAQVKKYAQVPVGPYSGVQGLVCRFFAKTVESFLLVLNS